MQASPRVMILGTGRAVPERVLTNEELGARLGVTDEWIVQRTGIRERRMAEPGTPLSPLALKAATAALEEAGVDPRDLGLIVVGTVTGDMKTPATACLLQRELQSKNAAGFDLSAACSGFLHGLGVAESLMITAGYRHGLVVGGDILTSILDWEDRDTSVLFGDGAGAAVLGPAHDGRGILSIQLHSQGRFADQLYSTWGGSLQPLSGDGSRPEQHALHMEGIEVFRHAVLSMAEVLSACADRAGVAIADLDMIIPHQANLRIIHALAKRVRLPLDKFYVNVERYGNTSAGSIPIALDEARRAGLVRPGALVGMAAFGAGFAWSGAILRV